MVRFPRCLFIMRRGNESGFLAPARTFPLHFFLRTDLSLIHWPQACSRTNLQTARAETCAQTGGSGATGRGSTTSGKAVEERVPIRYSCSCGGRMSNSSSTSKKKKKKKKKKNVVRVAGPIT